MTAFTPRRRTRAAGFPCPPSSPRSARRIGSIGQRFFGVPTDRSQRATHTYADTILAGCRDDGVDAVVLVPNCPVCHQTMTLVARHLEANGIATVIMGCAKDIVEHAAAPRFLFSDLPLGNSAGLPHDAGSQALTLELAFRLLEQAPGGQTTMRSPLRWPGKPTWRRDYNDVARLDEAQRAELRRAFDFEKARAPAKPVRA